MCSSYVRLKIVSLERVLEAFTFLLMLVKTESESCTILRPKAPEQQLCSGARGRTILYTQLWTDFLVSCLFKDHHVVYHHVCLFYHMYF